MARKLEERADGQRVQPETIYSVSINDEFVGEGLYLWQYRGKRRKGDPPRHEVLYRGENDVAKDWRFDDEDYKIEGGLLKISGGRPDPTQGAEAMWDRMLTKRGI